MDKADWENSKELLTNLLKKKKEEIEKALKDIAEIEYTVECYEKKIKEFA